MTTVHGFVGFGGTRGMFVSIGLFGVLGSLVSVLAAADGGVKEIDRRNASERNAYYVVFCARGGGLAGHAFVTLGVDDHDAQACKSRAFGLYPKEGKGVLGSVPGDVVEEAFKSPTTHRLVVRVNSPRFETVEEIRAKWRAQGEYRLIEKDCVTFVSAVADSLGLKTPSRDDAVTPEAFIQAMRKLND